MSLLEIECLIWGSSVEIPETVFLSSKYVSMFFGWICMEHSEHESVKLYAIGY